MNSWTLFKRRRKTHLLCIGFFSIFINLFMLVLPIYSLQVFSRVLTSRSIETLFLLAIIALGILMFQGILEFLRNRLLVISSAQFDEYCSEEVAEHALSTANHQISKSRELVNDLKLARQAMSSTMNTLLFDLPWSPVFILVIFSLHSLLGWFALVSTIILMLLSVANFWLIQKKLDQSAEQSVDNDGSLYKLLENAQSIDIFSTSKPLATRWYQKHISTTFLHFKATLYVHILQATIKYARMALQIGVIGIGAWLVISNEVDPGVMLASSILLTRILSPLDQGIHQWNGWRQSRRALRRVITVLSQQNDEKRIEMPIDNVALSVIKLSKRNNFNKLLLNNVQFQLKANNALAIIGDSGSGKSTLLSILAGDNAIEQGEVRINGINLSEILPSQRKRLIGYLPQRIELFNASVLENISCFSDHKETEQKVFKATKLIGVHQMICELPNAYNTIIGEGGVQLSGGQLQLIALARALYEQPKLLLLDEPDCNLDQQSQRQLQDTIRKLKSTGVSIIFVTHRKQLLEVVDWMLVMDKGSIVDAGKRSDVVTRLNSNIEKIN